MNIITILAGVVIFVAALFMNENRVLFMLVGAMFALMGAGMYSAARKKEIRH